MKKTKLYPLLSFQKILPLLLLAGTLLLASCRSTTSEEPSQPSPEPELIAQPTPESMIASPSEETAQSPTAAPLPAATQGVEVSGSAATPTPLPPGLAPVIVSGDFAGEGKPFTFDATASQTGDAPIVGYEWDMGDGTILFGVAVEHVFTTAGYYTVSLTVTDDSGATATTSKTVEVIELNTGPPVAVIEGPAVAFTGEEVTFSAANSQPGAEVIVAYEWSTGDGKETGPTPESAFTTVYDEPGIYFVEVNVIDANGLTDSAVLELSVEFSLVGTSWLMDEPIRGTDVTLVFDETTLSGSSGCNDYSASYSTTDWIDNSAEISIQITNSTNRSCAQEVMHQESGYQSFLQTASQITVNDSTLILKSGNSQLTFTQTAS